MNTCEAIYIYPSLYGECPKYKEFIKIIYAEFRHPAKSLPGLTTLKLGIKPMAFIVLILFLKFVSIKIRFGFSDVTHILGSPLCAE